MSHNSIRTKPEPNCPNCCEKMVLHKPKPTSVTRFRPFWGCPGWPGCNGKLEIDDNGLPVEDEFYVDTEGD